MPERDNGYKTIDVVMKELSATEDDIRALIRLLKIQPTFFDDDRRRRYYSPEDVARMRQAIGRDN